MKTQKIVLRLILLFFILAFTSCVQSTESMVPSVTGMPTPQASNTTILPLATATPTNSPTPIAIPTLSTEEAQKRLLDLLSNNSGCQLPCLWGITPGKSTSEEARTVLESFSSISESPFFDSERGRITTAYIEDDTRLFINASYLSENQIVNRVSFLAVAGKKVKDVNGGDYWIDNFDLESYRQRLHQYLLPRVLLDQGIPKEVLVSTDGGPARGKDVPGFYVLLLYPDQGLLVSYTTSRQLAGGIVRGCLASAEVELELFPSGNTDSFSRLLSQTKWANLWPPPNDSLYWKPIEKATSMSLEEFYETFLEQTDMCIETPANLWPVPER